MDIKTKFDFNDRVVMIPFDKEGEVQTITIDRAGIQYKIRYIVSDKFEYEWFYEDELKQAKKKKMGFND